MCATSDSMYARAIALRARGLHDEALAEERDALLVRRLERTLDEITRDSFEEMQALDAARAAGYVRDIRAGRA